jgi:hypothetical protein
MQSALRRRSSPGLLAHAIIRRRQLSPYWRLSLFFIGVIPLGLYRRRRGVTYEQRLRDSEARGELRGERDPRDRKVGLCDECSRRGALRTPSSYMKMYGRAPGRTIGRIFHDMTAAGNGWAIGVGYVAPTTLGSFITGNLSCVYPARLTKDRLAPLKSPKLTGEFPLGFPSGVSSNVSPFLSLRYKRDTGKKGRWGARLSPKERRRGARLFPTDLSRATHSASRR